MLAKIMLKLFLGKNVKVYSSKTSCSYYRQRQYDTITL